MQICEAFGANRYPFPEESQRQRQMNAEVTARLRELHTTVDAGEWQNHSRMAYSGPRYCILKSLLKELGFRQLLVIFSSFYFLSNIIACCTGYWIQYPL